MIVPRWEWRTFGDSFGEAEARLAGLPPTKVDDSDELYVLSSRVEASIKVRGGQLDVKRLEGVSDDGLEQWRPVAKAEFPFDATDVASLLGSLDVTVPSLDRATYELDALIDEVVGPHDELSRCPCPSTASTTSSTVAWRSSRTCARARGRREPSPSRTRIPRSCARRSRGSGCGRGRTSASPAASPACWS